VGHNASADSQSTAAVCSSVNQVPLLLQEAANNLSTFAVTVSNNYFTGIHLLIFPQIPVEFPLGHILGIFLPFILGSGYHPSVDMLSQ